MPPIPLLITTTHSGLAVPYEVLIEMLGSNASDPVLVQRRLDWLYRQNDPFTDRIFHVPGAINVHATVSRFVVDLNRDRDDANPNGVIKRTDFDLVPLYPDGYTMSGAEIAERLARYWEPFHDTVQRNAVHAELLIDGHAMTARGPKLGPDAGAARPAFCIMTGGDPRGHQVGELPPSLPPDVAQAVLDLMWRHVAPIVREAPGVPAEILLNQPFRIGGVIRRYGQSGGLPAFGIEVNRALYLEEREEVFAPRLDRIALLHHAMRAFATEVLALVT